MRHWFCDMKTIRADDRIDIPPEVARCPICGRKITAVAFNTHQQDEQGRWYAVEVSLECETEPDIDSPQWMDWFQGHYSMPYIDWLPLEIKVRAWLKENFRFEL